MACAFTHDIFEMIAMIAEVRTTCWSSDQAAARKLETPTSRHCSLAWSPKSSVEQAGWSGELYYAPPTQWIDWRTSECLQENGWHGRAFGRARGRTRPKSGPTHPARWYVQKNRVLSAPISSGELVKSLVTSDVTRVGKGLNVPLKCPFSMLNSHTGRTDEFQRE